MIDRLALALVIGFVTLLRVLPQRVADYLAYLVFRLVMSAMPRANKVALRNLEVAFPEKDVSSRQKIVGRSYRLLAKNLVAFARIPDLTPEYIDSHWDYSEWEREVVRAREASATGAVIVATMHFGLFEQIMQGYAVLRSHRSAALARGFGLPRLDAWWKARREIWKCTMFDRKGGFKELVKHLSEGTDTAILFDQNVKRNHAVFIDMFGVPAATTKSLMLAIERTGAGIVFAVSAEYKPGHWKILARHVPPELLKEGTPEERMECVMSTLHSYAEDAIREYPDHWLWFHRRYKTRPLGEEEKFYN
jgi:KDO2-lipid IV(A) lauroyltransferase